MQEEVRKGNFQCEPDWYLEVSCPAPLLRRVVLVDTPGHGALSKDDEIARDAIRQSAFVIFCTAAAKGSWMARGWSC